mgnify:CR=1 FL=1
MQPKSHARRVLYGLRTWQSALPSPQEMRHLSCSSIFSQWPLFWGVFWGAGWANYCLFGCSWGVGVECNQPLEARRCFLRRRRPTNPPTPASGMQAEPPDGGGGSLTKAESTTMLCEPNSPEMPHTKEVEEDSDLVSEKDLELICDLFYLPCEHGPKVRTANEPNIFRHLCHCLLGQCSLKINSFK